MAYRHSIIYRIFWLIAVFIPGFGWLLLRRWGLAFALPLLALLWVFTFSATRWVVTPLGFKVFIVGLVAWHAGHYLAAVITALRGVPITGQQAPPRHTLAIQVTLGALLISVNLGITLSSHFYKARWFGFAFYHIPSASMRVGRHSGKIRQSDINSLI